MEAWERAVIDTIRPYTTTTVEQQWAFISALKYVQMKVLLETSWTAAFGREETSFSQA